MSRFLKRRNSHSEQFDRPQFYSSSGDALIDINNYPVPPSPLNLKLVDYDKFVTTYDFADIKDKVKSLAKDKEDGTNFQDFVDNIIPEKSVKASPKFDQRRHS